jgi:hypothetical protein
VRKAGKTKKLPQKVGWREGLEVVEGLHRAGMIVFVCVDMSS